MSPSACCSTVSLDAFGMCAGTKKRRHLLLYNLSFCRPTWNTRWVGQCGAGLRCCMGFFICTCWNFYLNFFLCTFVYTRKIIIAVVVDMCQPASGLHALKTTMARALPPTMRGKKSRCLLCCCVASGGRGGLSSARSCRW